MDIKVGHTVIIHTSDKKYVETTIITSVQDKSLSTKTATYTFEDTLWRNEKGDKFYLNFYVGTPVALPSVYASLHTAKGLELPPVNGPLEEGCTCGKCPKGLRIHTLLQTLQTTVNQINAELAKAAAKKRITVQMVDIP